MAACLCLAAFIPARAQDPNANTLAVKAAFYDHEIGAFNGEFGARKPGECGYSADFPGPSGKTWAVTPDMVADTLPYSKAVGKKFPRWGPAIAIP